MQTPGPWNEDTKHTGGARAIIGDGQQLVALVYGETRDEQAANARAVSAANDFYEAALTMAHAEDSGGDAWWRGFEALKAALKKAGGQFPSMEAVRQPDICPGDQKHCKTEGDEAHFRCGTVQCGQKSLHQF